MKKAYDCPFCGADNSDGGNCRICFRTQDQAHEDLNKWLKKNMPNESKDGDLWS